MDDHLARVAEAVRDATLNKAWQIGNSGPLRSAVDLQAVIASVPRAETVAAQVAVPDGWKVVPVEPSIAACIIGSNAAGGAIDGRQCAVVYRAMLAAAPEATEPVLDHPASIGGTTFGVGIPVRTLVAAAQRRYEVEQTPASLADRQALIDALRHPVVDAELTTLREQNAALEQDAARYHALRAELIRADGPVDERGEIEKAIKEVMRKAYAERGDPMPTAAEFDTAIDISITSAEGGAA